MSLSLSVLISFPVIIALVSGLKSVRGLEKRFCPMFTLCLSLSFRLSYLSVATREIFQMRLRLRYSLLFVAI